MIGKFVGPCIAVTFDKRGTPQLVIDDTANGDPIPQTVRCWDKNLATIARGVQRGDVITADWKMEAKFWTPKDGSPSVWLPSSINATKLHVGTPARPPSTQPALADDDDVAF